MSSGRLGLEATERWYLTFAEGDEEERYVASSFGPHRLLLSAVVFFKFASAVFLVLFHLMVARRLFVTVVVSGILIAFDVYVSHFQRSCGGSQKRQLLSRIAIAHLIALFAFVSLVLSVVSKDNECQQWENTATLSQLSSQERLDACERCSTRGSLWALVFLAMLIPQPRAFVAIPLFVVFDLATFILLIVYGESTLVLLLNLFFCGTLSALKILSEKQTRANFAASRFLEDLSNINDTRREDLVAQIQTLVPPLVLQRIAHGGAGIDVAKHASCLILTAQITSSAKLDSKTVAAHLQIFREQVIFATEKVEKIATAGDKSYLTANLLKPNQNHADLLARYALSAQHKCRRHLPFALQGALHTGALTGTVVGETYLRYSLLGPAFEIARDAMNCCIANTVLVTEATKELLRDVDTEPQPIATYFSKGVTQVTLYGLVESSSVIEVFDIEDADGNANAQPDSAAASIFDSFETPNPLAPLRDEPVAFLQSSTEEIEVAMKLYELSPSLALPHFMNVTSEIEYARFRRLTGLRRSILVHFNLTLLTCLLLVYGSNYDGVTIGDFLSYLFFASIIAFAVSCWMIALTDSTTSSLVCSFVANTLLLAALACSRPSTLGADISFVLPLSLMSYLFLAPQTLEFAVASFVTFSLFLVFNYVPSGTLYAVDALWGFTFLIICILFFIAQSHESHQTYRAIAIGELVARAIDSTENARNRIIAALVPPSFRSLALDHRPGDNHRSFAVQVPNCIVLHIKFQEDGLGDTAKRAASIVKLFSIILNRIQGTFLSVVYFFSDELVLAGPLQPTSRQDVLQALNDAFLVTKTLLDLEAPVSAACVQCPCTSILSLGTSSFFDLLGEGPGLARSLAQELGQSCGIVFANAVCRLIAEDGEGWAFSEKEIWKLRGVGSIELRRLKKGHSLVR